MMSTTNDPESLLSPPYLVPLGLKRAPFGPGDAEEFFYPFHSLNWQLGDLYNNLQNLDVALVLGEPGIGKSTLVRHISHQLTTKSALFCVLKVESSVRFENMLTLLAESLKFTLPGSPEEQWSALSSQLENLSTAGRYLHVLVDDANHCSTETLEKLMALGSSRQSQRSSVRLILFAEPDFPAFLSQVDKVVYTSRNIQTFTIPPMTEKETATYLRHRMVAAGFSGETPFINDLVKDIYTQSRGIPGIANQLAHDTLMEVTGIVPLSDLYEEHHEGYRPGFSLPSIPILLAGGMAGAFLMLGIGYFLWSTAFNREVTPTVTTLHIQKPDKTESANLASDTTSMIAQSGSSAKEPPPAAMQGTASPASENDSKAKESGETKEGNATGSSTATTSHTASNSQATGKTSESVKKPDNKLPPGEEGIKPESQTTKTPPPVPPASMSALSPTTTTAAPEGSVTPPAIPVKPTASVKNAKWLTAKNPQHFTLQLTGSSNQQTLIDFATRYPLPGTIAYLETQRDGQPWYILVYETYPSREAAIQAKQSLPKEYLAQNPFIRSVSDLQAQTPQSVKRSPPQEKKNPPDAPPQHSTSEKTAIEKSTSSTPKPVPVEKSDTSPP